MKRAESAGPQDIERDGLKVAVVLSRESFERLSGRHASLVDFIRASPLMGLDDELRIEREGA